MPESIYNLTIFQGIEKETIDHIILNCEQRSYEDQTMIMIEWEASNGEGYIIKSGRVNISIGGNKIAELSEWDIVGEIALLNDEQRTATVMAQGNIEVIVLNLDDLINMINNDDNSINKTIMQRIEENISRG